MSDLQILQSPSSEPGWHSSARKGLCSRGSKRIWKAAGFPPLGWYDVLLELHRAGETGLRPVELESRLLLEQHNISRLGDRLEAAGYLARKPCPDDRRGQMLILTKAGEELLQRMWPVYRAAMQHHVGSKLKDEDAAYLATLLHVLIR